MSISATSVINATTRPEPRRRGAPAGAGGTIVDFAEARRVRRGEVEPEATPRIAVRIYCLSHRPKQAGKARQPWVLEFEPTTPTRTDPLMGWIGWGDPRQQVRLLFPTKAHAVAFAKRQGWVCDVGEPPTPAGLVDGIRQHAARPVSLAGLEQWHAVI